MNPATAITARVHPGSRKEISTPLGVFLRIDRNVAGLPVHQWMLALADDTEIVVGEIHGKPNDLHVDKAASVVASRTSLGKRAVLLIAPFFERIKAIRGMPSPCR